METLLLLCLPVAFVAVVWSKWRPSPAPMICARCDAFESPTMVTPGSLGVELVLWFCYILPGCCYTVWRVTSRYPVCAVCGSRELVPPDSPRGQRARVFGGGLAR